LNGGREADITSPASAAFIKLGNAESRVKTGQDLIGDTQNLVLSPVVIAMWKPMAEAIGWGKRPVGWSEILALAKDPRGWASVGKPQWGPFRFGHTHPESSNSGVISLMAEVYAGAREVRGLTLDDLARPEVGDYLGGIEQSVVQGELAVLLVNDGLGGGQVKGRLVGIGVQASVHKEVLAILPGQVKGQGTGQGTGDRSRGTGQGTGQISEKVKEGENGIGFADARSLSSEAGEGAGDSEQIGRNLNHESFRPNKARQAPGRNYKGNAKWCVGRSGEKPSGGGS
jgi:hypothetical protein